MQYRVNGCSSPGSECVDVTDAGEYAATQCCGADNVCAGSICTNSVSTFFDTPVSGGGDWISNAHALASSL